MRLPEELLMGMDWAAQRFYSIPSIVERMWRSKTGLWWNIIRNAGYHLALRNFQSAAYDPDPAPARSLPLPQERPTSSPFGV